MYNMCQVSSPHPRWSTGRLMKFQVDYCDGSVKFACPVYLLISRYLPLSVGIDREN